MQARLILLCFAIFSVFVVAQFDSAPCAHEHVMEKFFEENPGLLEEHTEIHQRIRAKANLDAEKRKNSQEKEILSTITIPVVWHVLVDPNNVAGTQVSEADIVQEMAYLNEWYSGTNTYYDTVSSIWADRVAEPSELNIRLELASQDEFGNPTTAIYYHTTSVAATCGDTEIFRSSEGGVDAWDTELFFNVWTCPITHAAGYAYYPSANTHYRDGMVIDPQFVGEAYRTGSIMAHELGHWLGLPHTFGSCSPGDEIADTPDSSINNLEFASSAKPCPGVGGAVDDDFIQCGHRIMVQNCMDYGWEQCRTSFTKGQAAVMRGWLEDDSTIRGQLKYSIGLGGGSPPPSGTTASPTRTRTPTPTVSPAAAPPPLQGGTFTATLLNMHNSERQNVVTPPLNPLGLLSWSDSVAAAAQDWVDTCTYGFDYSSTGNAYGKNLYAFTYDQTSTSAAIDMAESAMGSWAGTRNQYTLTANADGSVTQTCSASSCNNYKQIIWDNDISKTSLLGCAINFCTTGSPWGTGYNGEWTVMLCYYSLRGLQTGYPPYTPCPHGGNCPAGGCASTCLEGQCGEVVTDCGETIDCGECCTEDPCAQNACGDFTACGEPVSCAECESGLSCVNDASTGFNACVDAEDCHADECVANGVECGSRLYCGVNRVCGYCNADTHNCIDGECVLNPCNNCGGNMECVDDECVCLDGFVLSEGGAACEVPSTTGGNANSLDYSSVLRQTIPSGGSDFVVEGFEIQLLNNAGSHLLNWDASADIVDKYTTKTRATVSVSSGTFAIGVRTGQGSGRENDRIQWEIDQINGSTARLRLNLVYYGNDNYNGGFTFNFPTTDAEITVLMGFVDSSSSIRTEFQSGGYSKAYTIPSNYYPALGSISYFFEDTSGLPTLSELLLGTSSTVSITFVDCIDDAEWEDYFYLLTGADPSTTNVEIRDSGENGNCNKKSATTGKALVSGFTTVITSTSVPAAALSSKLAASAGTVNAAGIGFSGASVIPGAAGAQIAGLPVTAAGAAGAGGAGAGAGGAGGAGGLSGGAVAGIVVGSVGGAVLLVGVAAVVVAAVVAGAVYASKDENDSYDNDPQLRSNPQQAPKKRGSIRMTLVGMFSGPRGGVDVMNDPKGHQSISARSPEVK